MDIQARILSAEQPETTWTTGSFHSLRDHFGPVHYPEPLVPFRGAVADPRPRLTLGSPGDASSPSQGSYGDREPFTHTFTPTGSSGSSVPELHVSGLGEYIYIYIYIYIIYIILNRVKGLPKKSKETKTNEVKSQNIWQHVACKTI